MVDVGRVLTEDIKPADTSPLSMIRVASYLKDIEEAIALTQDFTDKGYETTINLMAISVYGEEEIKKALHLIEAQSPASVIYIVDSYGALYPDTVKELVRCFKEILVSKKIGFHGHNHQQLAFGNSLVGINSNAEFIDGTVYGIGRAAGNCPLELLLGYLDTERYKLPPVLDLISQELIPLSKEIEWGYIIPYALTGLKNEHPRSAIKIRSEKEKDNYSAFLKSLESGSEES